jgi:hypothetical protein
MLGGPSFLTKQSIGFVPRKTGDCEAWTKLSPPPPEMSLRSVLCFQAQSGQRAGLRLFEGVVDGSDDLEGNKSPAVKVFEIGGVDGPHRRK